MVNFTFTSESEPVGLYSFLPYFMYLASKLGIKIQP